MRFCTSIYQGETSIVAIENTAGYFFNSHSRAPIFLGVSG